MNHDQTGALQVRQQIVDLFLAVNIVIAARGAERHADAHAHAGDVVPAAHLLGGFLGFQIEIDDVFQSARIMKTEFAIENNFKLPPRAGEWLIPKSE